MITKPALYKELFIVRAQMDALGGRSQYGSPERGAFLRCRSMLDFLCSGIGRELDESGEPVEVDEIREHTSMSLLKAGEMPL